MKLYKILFLCVGMFLAIGASAKGINEARVYVNPGHGGWGPNDRPMATINYVVRDTLGFYETNTNLLKGFALRDQLLEAGVGYVKMSRTKNGIVAEGDIHKTVDDDYETADQIVTLSAIAMDVETNNMDYFISIHSNAIGTGGAITNYPLLLYRGTDTAVGNGLVEAKNMCLDAWKYVRANGITYYSAHTGANANNTRGDITFQSGSQSTVNGYTGYYGVLKHGCDGYLSEGCFHTYQPELHRLLNPDYCRQEGVRYSRAIRAWFGDNSETKGYIMGTVKDKNRALKHNLYAYALNSIDAHYPLNEVTVILQDKDGNKIDEYTTDKEYNGVFVFGKLEPGTYKLVFDIEDYWKEEDEIEVVANETSFINKRLTSLKDPEPEPEEEEPQVEDYFHPEQDGDIVAPASYNFTSEYRMTSEALAGLTIRRAILRNGNYYILAVDDEKNPKLMVLDAQTGNLLKNMSTEGISTEGYGGKKHLYNLSDIAFTMDDVLIGVNSTVVGRENNSYQTGDFYVYKWQGDETNSFEDVDPVVVYQLPTNTTESILAAGNNYSNLMANSIAVSGTIDNFKLYFDSHASDSWDDPTFPMRYVCWVMEDGELKGTQWNGSQYNCTQISYDVKMALSPLAVDRIIVDGKSMQPKEFEIDWESNAVIETDNFSGETLPEYSMGATYFRYAGKIYMVTPTCEIEPIAITKYSYGINLYDVTAGLENAVLIAGILPGDASGLPIADMAAFGVVDNADIELYLLVNDTMRKYTTKGVEQLHSTTRVFAYNLVSVYKDNGYEITFDLFGDAHSAALILTDSSGEVVKTFGMGSLQAGKHTNFVPDTELQEDEIYNWSVSVTADNVIRFTKISDDTEAYRYFAPKGVAIDNSPESDYFGRVYITNTGEGEEAGRSTSTGMYVMGPDGSDITGQGNNAYTGGIAWTGANAEGPRKAAVAADGRVFVADASLTNAGIYLMNPETFEISSIFPGATITDGSLTIGGKYVCGQIVAVGVRGEGEDTQLYGVDKTASGQTWKKHVNLYNIGNANTWTTEPVSSVVLSSFIGNDNGSIAPISTGYWAGQFRGAGSNSKANPCMYYYSDAHSEVVYNSFEPDIISTASANGALAVSEKEGMIALSNDGGVSIFYYKMDKEGVPVVTEKFWNSLSTSGVTYDDFEFDYAGNLYAVSYSNKLVSVWAMPTENNSCVVPARKSMFLVKGGPVQTKEVESPEFRIYPNPVVNEINIESPEMIGVVEVYDVTGTLMNKFVNVNSNFLRIDCDNYAQGIYFIRIDNNNAIKVVKR